MSCRRTYEMDLAAYLAEPRAEEFAGFRDHYPRCAACSAEVRAWTEVEGLLRGPEEHPDPAELLQLEEAPDGLAPLRRAALEDHVRGCPACRDELGALRAFDPASLTSPAPAAAREASGGPTAGLAALLAGLRRLVVSPAFAYALLLVVAAPTVYRLVAPGGAPPRIAADEEVALRERVAARPEEAAESLHDLRRAPAVGDSTPTSAPQLAARKLEAAPEAESFDAPEAPRPPAPAPEAVAKAASPRPAAGRPEVKRAPAEVADALEARESRMEAQAPMRDDAGTAEVEVEMPEARESLRALGYQVEADEAPAKSKIARERASAPRQEAEAGFAADEAAVVAAGPVLRPAGEGLYRLHVPLAPGTTDAELRLTSPGGGRMLSEHFRNAGDEAVLELPAAWLEPGAWRIERRARGRTDVFVLEVPALAAPRTR